MSDNKAQVLTSKIKECWKICSTHELKKISKFCKEHDTVVCDTCLIESQAQCNSFLHIEQAAKGVMIGNNIQDLLSRMKGLSTHLANIINRCEEYNTYVAIHKEN